MGKQSARLYYQGKDHKDIFYRGNFHNKMYKGSQLLWEKLYPDAYFLGTIRKSDRGFYQYKTIILSKDGVEESVQGITYMSDYTIYITEDFGQKFVMCDVRKRINNGSVQSGHCATPDIRRFKAIGASGIVIGEAIYYNDEIAKISDDLKKIDIIECEELPQIEDLTADLTLPYDCLFRGNYLFWVGHKIEVSSSSDVAHASVYFSVLDKEGKRKLFQKDYDIPSKRNERPQSQEATEYFVETSLESNDSIVMQDYVYWIGWGYSIMSANYFMSYQLDGVYCKNLSTCKTTKVIDFAADNHSIKNGNINTLYASVNKAVLLHSLDAYQAIIIKLENGNAQYNNIRNMSVKVYGEDRTMNIVSDEYISDVKVNRIVLSNHYSIIETTNYSVLSALVTMDRNGYKPDAVDGMAFAFRYGEREIWEIYGYMYIDNQDFAESENNYIYILEEYENEELIFSR